MRISWFRGLFVFTLAAFPAFGDYSAVNDFPTISLGTPATNGVWSYGYSAGVNPVNLIPGTASPDWFGDGNAAGFGDGINTLPTVMKNISGTTLTNEGGTIGPWPTNLLLLHPAQSGEYAIVRFTAPTSATYAVTTDFLAIGNTETNPNPAGVTTDSANLTVAGPTSTQLYQTTSTSSLQVNTFDQYLSAGQSLDFAVGLGPQGQYNYDSTGFNATISATPEPGFYGLVALGLSGLLLAGISRKKA